MAACTLSDLQADACSNGFAAMSDGDKMAILLQLLCNISSSGGAGGVVCGAYAGQPTFTPASGCGVAIDTTTDIIYWYYSGSWHP